MGKGVCVEVEMLVKMRPGWAGERVSVRATERRGKGKASEVVNVRVWDVFAEFESGCRESEVSGPVRVKGAVAVMWRV